MNKLKSILFGYYTCADTILDSIRPENMEDQDAMGMVIKILYYFSQGILYSFVPIFLVQLFTNLFGETFSGNFTWNLIVFSQIYCMTRFICELFFSITYSRSRKTQRKDNKNMAATIAMINGILCMIVKNESQETLILMAICPTSLYCLFITFWVYIK